MGNFPFLKSNRFWALVLFGVAIWFGDLGWFPAELVAFIQTVTAGHIGIRSLDRLGESIGKKK